MPDELPPGKAARLAKAEAKRAAKVEAKANAKAAKAGKAGKAHPDAPPPDAPANGQAKAPRRMPALGAPLAVLALLAGLGAAALGALGQLAGVLLLPWAAVLLALASVAPARPKALAAPEPAKLRMVALAFLALAMLLALALIEGLALFAATGLVFTFVQLAALVVAIYPALLGAMVALGALARIAHARWGHDLEIGAGRKAVAAGLVVAALLPAALILLAALPATADLVPIEVTVERAPFVGAIAVAAALGALWACCLPSFGQAADWLGRAGLRQARVAKKLTAGFAYPAMVGALAGAGVWIVLDEGLGIALLGAGLLLGIAAGFPAGVARFVPALTLDDPERAMVRARRGLLALLGLACLGMAASAAGLVAGLMLGLDVAAAGAAGFAVLALGLLALLSPRFPVPSRLTDARRGGAAVLSVAALLLTLFALLLGGGVVSGPGVGPSLGLALLLAACFAGAGQSLLRVVLVPPQGAKQRAPKKAKEKVKVERDTKEQITRSMHLVYAAGLGFTVLMVALVGMTSLNVVDVQSATGLPPLVLPVLGAMAGLPFLGYAGWRFLKARSIEVARRQEAKSAYKKRLTSAEVSRIAIIASTVTLALVFVVLGVLIQFGAVQSLGPIGLTPKYSTDFFVFAILVGLGPYGFILSREQARIRAIDAKFPEFLRDLAESKRAGMTLTQAVVTASKGNYGALTGDIRKMAAQIEWGVSFGEALQRFARRVRTPLIERSVSLIVQASEAGGNVVDILHAAAEDAREIQLLLRERKTAMSIYVMIIYIAFFVFLSVIAILDAQFLPEVAKAVGGAQGVQIGPIKFGKVDTDSFEQVFFHAAIVQAVGGGFVAGVMEEGRAVAGLRHVFIMVAFGYVAFRFVIGG
jgi:flagellar protein FlaJ